MSSELGVLPMELLLAALGEQARVRESDHEGRARELRILYRVLEAVVQDQDLRGTEESRSRT